MFFKLKTPFYFLFWLLILTSKQKWYFGINNRFLSFFVSKWRYFLFYFVILYFRKKSSQNITELLTWGLYRRCSICFIYIFFKVIGQKSTDTTWKCQFLTLNLSGTMKLFPNTPSKLKGPRNFQLFILNYSPVIKPLLGPVFLFFQYIQCNIWNLLFKHKSLISFWLAPNFKDVHNYIYCTQNCKALVYLCHFLLEEPN